MAAERSVIGIDINALPDDCIANALSLTSPRDACRLSLVSSSFHAAAQFDAVWERFLPSHYRDVVSRAANGSDLLNFASKKDLYFHLCDHPILLDGGTMSFSLEKKSGNKCCMLAARSLKIVWGEDDRYWKWISLPHSRFSEVAVLDHVWWLEIRGEISPKMLSPGTNYGAYLVFSLKSNAYGFDTIPIDASVGISGQEAKTRTVYLGFKRSRVGPSVRVGRLPAVMRHNTSSPSEEENTNTGHVKQRSDHWMEVEMGDILVTGAEEEEECIEMSFMEVRGGNVKSGLVVQGIEIRPKEAMS